MKPDRTTYLTLYEILEVSRDASATVIKQAYKRLCMKHHPDRGGDKAVFQSIEQAYRVLSDRERRTHYDATGSANKPLSPEEQAERDRNAAAMQVLQGAIVKALQNTDEEHQDLVAGVLSVLQGALKEGQEALDKLQKAQQRATRAAGRVVSEDNVLQGLLRGLATQLDAPMAAIKIEMETLERAMEVAGRHTYEYTQMTQDQMLEKMMATYANRRGSIFGGLNGG